MGLPMEKPQNERYTYADLLSWDTDIRYELYDGVPVALASPSPEHQRIVRHLLVGLEDYIQKNGCGGEVFPAPLDVRIFEGTSDRPEDVIITVQPDLMVVCDRDKLDEKGVRGAPDFIIEVLSPTTERNDRYTKFSYYQRAGVREYWIVDPSAKHVQTFLLEEGRYIAQVYSGEQKVSSGIFEGLEIDLEPVFCRINPAVGTDSPTGGNQMDNVKFSYQDLLDIFGQDAKLELYDGVIYVGDKTFDEIVETYLRIKADKQNRTE